jgi:hypothetical protein
MNRIALISLMFLYVLFLSGTGYAEAPDPAATVRAMVTEMKAEGGFASMLKFVHWETAFARMDPAERNAMGVTTPEDLRKVTHAFLEDPARALTDRMEGSIAKMSEDRQVLVRKVIEEQQARLQEKLQTASRRMAESEYEIGAVEVSGDTATVELKSTFNEVQTSKNIILTLIDGTWYLPTGDISDVHESASQEP